MSEVKEFLGEYALKDVVQNNLFQRKKLTNWKNEPTVEDLMFDIDKARPTHLNQVAKINEWVNLLYAETDKKKIKRGRSGITPKVIRRLAEWRYGSLSTSFLNERKLFQVNATHPNYLQGAIQNELVLNFQFNALIDKVKFINDLVRSAVNEGTAIVRVGWETQTRIDEEEIPVFEYLEPDIYEQEMLSQAIGAVGQETQQLGLEDSSEAESFQSFDPELQESIKASSEFGMPVSAVDTGSTQKIKVERVIKNRPQIKVIPNASLIIDPSCEGEFERAKFVAYQFTTSYSELKQEGIYKNLEDIFSLNAGSETHLNYLGIDDATFQRTSDYGFSTFNFKDKARKRLLAYEYWGYWDIDNTGIVKPIVATIVDGTIIRLEESPFPDNELPFVVIPYLPVKGSVYGEPDAELVKDNQEIIQALTRSMIDIQARSANAQVARPKGFLDTINTKRFNDGEDYEYNPTGMHPSQAIFMHTANEIPQSILTLLQQQYAEAEAATGVKSFQGGLDENAYGQAVQGMSQAITAITQREGDILFRLSKGLEKIGNKILAMNSIWLNEEEHIAITQNEFVPIRREDLAGDFFLNVNIKSNNEAEGKAQQLTFVAQTLGGDVDWSIRKLFISEICKLYNLDSMLSAIQAYEPPPPSELEQQKMQLEVEKLQAELQKLQAEAQYSQARSDYLNAQIGSVQEDIKQKQLDQFEQEYGIENDRKKEVVEAQAEAQGRMKREEREAKDNADLAKTFLNNQAKERMNQANNEARERISRNKPQANQRQNQRKEQPQRNINYNPNSGSNNAIGIDPLSGRTYFNGGGRIPQPFQSGSQGIVKMPDGVGSETDM